MLYKETLTGPPSQLDPGVVLVGNRVQVPVSLAGAVPAPCELRVARHDTGGIYESRGFVVAYIDGETAEGAVSAEGETVVSCGGLLTFLRGRVGSLDDLVYVGLHAV